MKRTHRIVPLVMLLLTINTNRVWGELPRLTSLSDGTLKFTSPGNPYVVLRRGDIEAVVVNNESVNDKVLPGHKAGYSGLAALKHSKRSDNLFVPAVSGLNFEHIHDGTTRPREILFEPRNAPMELRLVDEFTAELYQRPTPTWGLESCHRYRLLADSTIEMTFECIPRQATFKNGYIGLFWASYIDQPESLDVHFLGHQADEAGDAHWIRGITPRHGVESTHLATDDQREPVHDPDFPLTLVFNRSRHRYREPWFFGISHGMAYLQLFRPQDQVRLTQSPSGGGMGNPAWDFQYLIPDYKLNERYQFVMRAKYVPFESRRQIRELARW